MFKTRSRYYITAVLAACLLSFASCKKSNPAVHGGNNSPIRVKTVTASPAEAAAAESEPYSGTLEAGNSTTVSFSVAGTIKSISVSEGQHVSKGQLIATVDGSSLKNGYDIALATLHEAQDAYDRMKKLHDADALPDMQWVAVQDKLKQAQAAAEIAKTGMNDANIYAPISGVIAHKLADVGQTVAPGLPVVEIMDVGSVKVKISVPESDLAKMKTGTSAIVTVGDRTYDATLVEKAISANALSHNYDVKFRITKPDDTLLPGMICTVNLNGALAVAQTDKAVSSDIILPPGAVVLDFDNTAYVWVKQGGVAVRRPVTVGGLDSRGVVITGGLNPTDSVIIEGQQKLSSGLKVESVK